MTTPNVLAADLQRVAGRGATPAALAPVIERLVARIPLRSRVLEIGCGNGQLARELATRRGARVTAVDVSSRAIEMARVRTPASLGIEYRVADFMALSPSGFDVVVAVDTLDELPIDEGCARMAASVVAGGSIVIVGRCRPVLRAPWETPALDVLSLVSVRQLLRRVLPGSTVRRHLGGHYTATWRR
jgi:2-polyprenyl-3-methyl-5-hydroxy-6-metoxy-1,4-benzoquinol methylase